MQNQVPLPVGPPSAFPSYNSVNYGNPPYYPQQQAPPNYGHDPALNQFASFLQNQDTENKKLREVLEGFGKNTRRVEDLDENINNATADLSQL